MAFYSNPKRKEYVLNPRGKALYEDTSRFGTKMLEKMGWSKGKGLGTKLEGNLDFIKVSHKSDQKGIGFADRDDQWTQHEANFNSLLKSFNTSTDADLSLPSNQKINTTHETSVSHGFGFKSATKKSLNEQLPLFSGISLEEQSKKSKARVHYKKFTRGKDMARYSEKDLANIFGKKSLNDDGVEDLHEITIADDGVKDEKTVEPILDNNFGITIIGTGTSINDYFKMKMEEMRRKNGLGNDGSNPFGTPKKPISKNDDDVSGGVSVIDESSNSNNLKIKQIKKNNKINNSDETNEDDDLLSPPPSKKKRKNYSENEKNTEITRRSPSPSPPPTVTKKSKNKNKKDKDKVLENIQNNSCANTKELLNISVCSQIEDFIIEKKKNMIDNEDEIFEIPNALPDETFMDTTAVTGDIKSNGVGKKKKNKKKKLENTVSNGIELNLKRKNKKNKKVNQQIHFPKVISNLLNHVYAPHAEYSITETALELNSNSDAATISAITKNAPNSTPLSSETISDSTTFEIAKYKAEIFRFYDLNGFVGSNLCNITGYGFDKNLQLKIVSSHNDAQRINRFWDELVNNKYGAVPVKSSKTKYQLKHKQKLKKNVFKI